MLNQLQLQNVTGIRVRPKVTLFIFEMFHIH